MNIKPNQFVQINLDSLSKDFDGDILGIVYTDRHLDMNEGVKMNKPNLHNVIAKHFETWCLNAFNNADIELHLNSDMKTAYSVNFSPSSLSFVLSDEAIYNEAMLTGKSVRKITHEKLDEALEFIYNATSEALIIEYPALQQYLAIKLGL